MVTRFGTCLGFVLALLVGSSATAETIWFAPPDNLPRGEQVFGPDFDDLFSPNARWDGALSHVNVFVITPRYSFASPEQSLARVLDVIGKHRIKLAVAMQAVTKRADCGTGLEGMTPANGVSPIMRRLRKLGADLKFAVMDEPVYFGHFYKGPNGCQYDLNALVDAIVPSAKAIFQEYPDAQIGETEPLGPSLPPNWLADLARYLDLYREKVGRPLSFVQADITWGSNWQPQLRQLRTMLKSKNVELGVIFNAPGPGVSDEAWVANAVHNIRIAAGGRQIHEWRDEHDEQRFDILVAASYELPCLRPRRGVVRLAAPDPTSPQFRSDRAALCACVSLCGYDRIGYGYDRSEIARRVRVQCCLR